MALIKIEIKNRWTGEILFSFESENNTIKNTLLEAVRKNVNLSGVNLSGADLYGADLRCANLYGANLSGASLCNANLSGANLRNADLVGANLRYADLRGANLRGADINGACLRDTNFSGADLRCANLSGADLTNAYLGGANLYGAYLSGANLRNAYLRNADIRCAILHGADLHDADINGACLRDTNFSGAKEIPFVPFYCPSEGSFIGWKKVNNYLIKLQIPEDAKRSSATSQKCRCDKAKVLAITKLDGTNPISEIENFAYSPSVLYKVGEMVIPDSFDEDRWNECSHGIHFFINKQDAINYNV